MHRTFLIATAAFIAGSGVALADHLDEWCKTVKLPSSIAICSEPELKALAIERQHAFDEARSRLNLDQQKALLSDQNGWVRSYASACGLTNAPPPIPLPGAIKECMAQAGRARVAYLHAYGGTSPKNAEVGPPTSLTAPGSATPEGKPLSQSQPSYYTPQSVENANQELANAWRRISTDTDYKATASDFETYLRLVTPYLRQKRAELTDLQVRCRTPGPWSQVCNQQISIFREHLQRDEERKSSAEAELRDFNQRKEAAEREQRDAEARREALRSGIEHPQPPPPAVDYHESQTQGETKETNANIVRAAEPTPTTHTFGRNELAAITDASAHNESRFKRDYQGKMFSAFGTLESVDEGSWLTGGDSQVNVRIGWSGTVHCFKKLDPTMVANWPSNMPIKITGIIDDTVLGNLRLKECELQPRN